jgi:hypothetical protein
MIVKTFPTAPKKPASVMLESTSYTSSSAGSLV